MSGFLSTYSRSFLPDDSLGINARMMPSIKFSEECRPSDMVRFPGWFFLLLNSSKFSLNFLSLNVVAWLPVLPRFCFYSPHSGYVNLFLLFFGCLVLFFSVGTDTSISLHHFPALCFSVWYPVCWLAQICTDSTVQGPAVVTNLGMRLYHSLTSLFISYLRL